MLTTTKVVARRALGTFRTEQRRRLDDHTPGCHCDDCVESMKKAIEQALYEVNRGMGWHPPVCALCQMELRPEKNGVGILDMADFGPLQIWDADLWKCPSCQMKIIAGFGHNPVEFHFNKEAFERTIKFYRDHSQVFEARS